MWLDLPLREGRNFEVQWTGKNTDRVAKAIEEFKAADDGVELHSVHVTAEESAQRCRVYGAGDRVCSAGVCDEPR